MTQNRCNIYLVGPMGSGKTTVGRLLAKRLGMTFLDSDHELEAHTGVRIPVIFEHEGEAGFRDREQAMIDSLCQRPNIVMATGGGSVIREQNRRRLKSSGFVIYLHAPVDQLLQRTGKDKNRPLLQTPDPRATLSELLEERQAYYREVANLCVDTSDSDVRHVVETILSHVDAE